ncbi:MAG: hypothetical protein HC933_00705 [Pleurocapsa sp. SU_196_0]|nr:hypothetical protein [Pleurocapsa sp. SU_196_0]
MTAFFGFDGQKIPIRKDEATEFYVDGVLESRRPLVTLLGDGSWAVEGQTFAVNILGERMFYQVVRVEYEIDLHQKRGRYGQLRRRVLIALIVNPELILEGGLS